MKNLLIFSVLLSLNSYSYAAIKISSNSKAGQVEFEAIGKPSMIKIKGTGEGAVSSLTIDQNKLSGAAAFRLDSLKTGIDMRDEHMKEKYLNVKQNPIAKMVFKDVLLPASWSLTNPTAEGLAFKATLQLNGVQKEVNGTLNVESADLKSNAEFEILLSDFGIEIPQYLGIKVADKVKIKVGFNQMNKVTN